MHANTQVGENAARRALNKRQAWKDVITNNKIMHVRTHDCRASSFVYFFVFAS